LAGRCCRKPGTAKISARQSRLSAHPARQTAGQRSLRYDKYIPGQEIRFHANSHFYRGTPPTPRFIYRVTNPSTNFQLFQTGETDYDAFTSRPDDIEQLRMLGFANINLTAPATTARWNLTSIARR
jgi:hypothetical protein